MSILSSVAEIGIGSAKLDGETSHLCWEVGASADSSLWHGPVSA